MNFLDLLTIPGMDNSSKLKKIMNEYEKMQDNYIKDLKKAKILEMIKRGELIIEDLPEETVVRIPKKKYKL